MDGFETKKLSKKRCDVAPDGSDARTLLKLSRGSLVHFELPPDAVSRAGVHDNVEEIWYVLKGRGEMWRKRDERDLIVALEPGVCVTVPPSTHFQFRSTGFEPLSAIVVTMPPWPGPQEWSEVKGVWPPTV
ncbi:MAG: cupin domain-containing protein [Candidatus Bathyarchaeota archaeon]